MGGNGRGVKFYPPVAAAFWLKVKKTHQKRKASNERQGFHTIRTEFVTWENRSTLKIDRYIFPW